MKAAIRSKYGSPNVLSIKELEIPTPKDNEVLIRVYATTVNRTDLAILTGKPFIMKLYTGLFGPELSITGTDFAGQIEVVGKTVRSFKAGDKVMGFGGIGLQSHAQYLAIPETLALTTMPENINYDQAAACLEGAYYAVNFINKVKLNTGQKVLVNGATGAIGSAAVQFLKYYGIYVTAVCSNENFELVISLGADKLIDYKTGNFTKDNEQYDFIFDTVGKSSFAQCKPLLKKNGVYIPSEGYLNILLALITPAFGGKKVIFPYPQSIKAGLSFIKELIEKGSFRPVIDRTYSIDKIAEAYTYVASGQKSGNVIITMDA